MINQAIALAATLILGLTLPQAVVQTPAFDVATIKPANTSRPRHMIGVMNTPDGLDAELVSVATLLRAAYGFQIFPLESQVIGVPDWAKSQTYDIHAKLSEADATALHQLPAAEQQHLLDTMLQSLLIERFHLKLHRGTRQVAAYDLIPAKGGPRMTAFQQDAPDARDADGNPIQSMVLFRRKGEITVQQSTMSHFATFLTQQPGGPGRPVVDKTGLPGAYTFTLRWSSVQSDPDAPSIFTILPEDLGLKLQPSTATVDTLIVDHLDPPTPN